MGPDSIKVLLVEDNLGDARLVHEMLLEVSAYGFQLTHAKTLQEACEYLATGYYDTMLLDLSLPDAHGLDSINHVLNVSSTLPIVVLSGLDDTDMAIEAVQSGAQDYLVKGQGDGNLLTRSLRYAIERKRSEERLTYLAQYDPLTNLPNRMLFHDRLDAALQHAKRHDERVDLMFLDLDHFKDINDRLGHKAGDDLLVNVAQRLQGCIRAEDTVARLGGDEFTIIMQGVSHGSDVATVANKMVSALSKPFTLSGEEIFVTISIGIATYPDCGDHAEALIRNADTALYRAKSDGRSNYKFYSDEMGVAVNDRMTMIDSLRQAVHRGEFQLHYQPLVNTRSGKVFGVEALLRWQHPNCNPVPTAEFIPLLEETGLIHPVGEWVFHESCRQIRLWQQEGLPPLCISINLSVRQFQKHGLASMIANVLKEYQLDPSLLQLEITENILADDSAIVTQTLTQLHGLGVRLVIDDFGTGYSSLSYLKDYPFDTLKFDQAFIHDITTSKNSASIIAALIKLGQSIGMTVMAEGVETQHQFNLLNEMGCDQYQGYLYARPMDATTLSQWMHKHHPRQTQL